MNYLIDEFPREYDGYLINSGFKTGILISECMIDPKVSEEEKLYLAFRMLFGKGIPPFDIAIKGLKWFLSCGETSSEDPSEVLFSFNVDHSRIFSAFKVKYGINLNNQNIHFFEFISLFNDLQKTSFADVVHIRSMKPKDMKNYSHDDKAQIMHLKRVFAIKPQYTDKQIQAIENFDELYGEKE